MGCKGYDIAHEAKAEEPEVNLEGGDYDDED